MPEAKVKKKTEKKTEAPKKEKKVKKAKKVKVKDNPNHKWYVLTVQSGHENGIAKTIKQRAEATDLQKSIGEVLVPVQKKIVVKNGKQTIKEERIFPGYVLLKMELDQHTWGLIVNTDGVRGFVRTDKYPRPLPESEVKAIMKFMEVDQPSYQATFTVGEAVKILDGAFADFIGNIQELDDNKGKVKVLISFLGREAPVELDFSQVTKLS